MSDKGNLLLIKYSNVYICGLKTIKWVRIGLDIKIFSREKKIGPLSIFHKIKNHFSMKWVDMFLQKWHKRILKKFTSLNPGKYASGQVLIDANLMKKADPIALYTKDQYGNWNVYPNFDNLLKNNNSLNQAFIDATPKKKKAYNS